MIGALLGEVAANHSIYQNTALLHLPILLPDCFTSLCCQRFAADLYLPPVATSVALNLLHLGRCDSCDGIVILKVCSIF